MKVGVQSQIFGVNFTPNAPWILIGLFYHCEQLKVKGHLRFSALYWTIA